MSNILDRLVCASANGERAPVDADDIRALLDLCEASPGEHPAAGRAVPPQRVPREPRLGRAGGGRVVVRHRPLRRLPRRLRHRGRGDGGPRREGELARRPPTGAPPAGLGALHRLAGASHRAASGRGLPRDPAALRVAARHPPSQPRGQRLAHRPLSRAAHFEPGPVRASRSRSARPARPPAPAGGGGRPVSGRPARGRGVPSCRTVASSPPETRRERGPPRRRALRARRSRVPPVPAPRPAPGPLLGRGRPRRRPWALALRAAQAPRHAGKVDRCRHRRARRPARPRAPPLARADASRGARRGPRLPRSAGCAGRGRGRGRCLRRDASRPPSLGALPRHRRHPC